MAWAAKAVTHPAAHSGASRQRSGWDGGSAVVPSWLGTVTYARRQIARASRAAKKAGRLTAATSRNRRSRRSVAGTSASSSSPRARATSRRRPVRVVVGCCMAAPSDLGVEGIRFPWDCSNRYSKRRGGRSRTAAGGPSGLVDGLVDAVGVVLQPLGAVLEPLLSLDRQGGAEQVADLELAIPAAQPLQALLLLVQLGQSELGGARLLVQFGLVLAALGEELGPFGLPGGGE